MKCASRAIGPRPRPSSPMRELNQATSIITARLHIRDITYTAEDDEKRPILSSNLKSIGICGFELRGISTFRIRRKND